MHDGVNGPIQLYNLMQILKNLSMVLIFAFVDFDVNGVEGISIWRIKTNKTLFLEEFLKWILLSEFFFTSSHLAASYKNSVAKL